MRPKYFRDLSAFFDGELVPARELAAALSCPDAGQILAFMARLRVTVLDETAVPRESWVRATRAWLRAAEAPRADCLLNDAPVLEATSSGRQDPAQDVAHASVSSSLLGSITERWVTYVLKDMECDVDTKTMGAWARFLGISRSSLCEACRLVGIRPRDARDLARVLRAVSRSAGRGCGCRPEAQLDVSDRRTLRELMRRAGIRRESAPTLTPAELLRHQEFIPQDNEALLRLRAVIGESAETVGPVS